MNAAIQIEGLSKIYNRVSADSPYATLRDALSNAFKTKRRSNVFAALDDVTLTIHEGSRTGIIGRNGAGKSTLLKVISQITPPTKGQVILNGRVASLLEVGTGFHPELTGRENIYLNGSLLGLKKAEINQRLEEIVDFSGVESFLDTPLKHYSSGMQLRLAFSVAAHLEPEILLVDEVLAVGDIEFQRKCIGKMEEVSKKSGRTIVLVSHNMEAVMRLCDKGVWLQAGKVAMHGEMSPVVSAYLADTRDTAVRYEGENNKSVAVCIIKGWIETGEPIPNRLKVGEPLVIRLKVTVNEQKKFSFEVLIRDSAGEPLLFLPIGLAHSQEHSLRRGNYDVTITAALPFLTRDVYFVDLITANTNKHYIHYLESALYFEMEGKVFDATHFEYTGQQRMGKILLTEGVKIEIQ